MPLKLCSDTNQIRRQAHNYPPRLLREKKIQKEKQQKMRTRRACFSTGSDSVFIGVTDENHICKSIPFEDHDVPMNALVTPKRFIPINL